MTLRQAVFASFPFPVFLNGTARRQRIADNINVNEANIPPVVDGHAGTSWGSNGATTSGNFNLTTTKTNDIIVVIVNITCTGVSNPTVSSVTATGLSFVQRGGNGNAGSSGTRSEIWWAVSAVALSAKTITVTLSSAPSQTVASVVGFGVNGVQSLISPWDTQSGLPAGSFGSGGSFSTFESDDLLIGSLANAANTSSPGTPTGWTNIDQEGLQFGGAVQHNYAASLTVANAGAHIVNWTGFVTFDIWDALTADAAPPISSVALAVAALSFAASVNDPTFTRTVNLAIAKMNFTISEARMETPSVLLAIAKMAFAVSEHDTTASVLLTIAKMNFLSMVHRVETTAPNLAVAHPNLAVQVYDVTSLTRLRQFSTFG